MHLCGKLLTAETEGENVFDDADLRMVEDRMVEDRMVEEAEDVCIQSLLNTLVPEAMAVAGAEVDPRTSKNLQMAEEAVGVDDICVKMDPRMVAEEGVADHRTDPAIED